MHVLLVYPPAANPTNTYSSLPTLAGFLRARGVEVTTWDLNIEFFLEMFKEERVAHCLARAEESFRALAAKEHLAPTEAEQYRALARALSERRLVAPEKLATLAERLRLPKARWTNEPLDAQPITQIRALFRLASAAYFPEEIRLEGLNSPQHLPFDRSVRVWTWNEFFSSLSQLKLFDLVLPDLVERRLASVKPDLVGVSLTYSDQIVAGFKAAKLLRERLPTVPLVAGGAFVSASLREIHDPRFFEFFDAFGIDGGEWPLWELTQAVVRGQSGFNPERLSRIKSIIYRENGTARHTGPRPLNDWASRPAPDFRDVPFSSYLAARDEQSLPLMLAHGCYWAKCTFCDKLPYVTDYRLQSVDSIVEKIKAGVAQTGITKFHFVDEACPPKVLKHLAGRLLTAGVHITWYGNVRLEKTFSLEVCRVLKLAGCELVSVGLESLSQRVLDRMKKGTTVRSAIAIMKNMSKAGIKVHTFLVAGFPGETDAELRATRRGIERLLRDKIIESFYWHPFQLVAGTDISKDPAHYGVTALGAYDEIDARYPEWIGARSATLTTGILPATARKAKRTARNEARGPSARNIARALSAKLFLPDHVTIARLPFSLGAEAPRSPDGAPPLRPKAPVTYVNNLRRGIQLEAPEILHDVLKGLDGSSDLRKVLTTRGIAVGYHKPIAQVLLRLAQRCDIVELEG